MARLTIDQFTRFFSFYRDLPHQRLAVAELWKKMPVALLEDDADWILTYRDPAVDEDPDVPVVFEDKPASENSWEGVYAAAKCAGAKFPECVAAQWALESGWGEHTSGQNNFFGVKATGGESYSSCTTWEVYDGKRVEIVAKFKDYESLQDCIDDLVTKWYLDFKEYKGVNRADTAEECAELLRFEGYATDPQYSQKLIGIMHDQA